MDTEPDILIRARALTLGYGDHRVLTNADLDVRRGEMWFFIGPNGTGKTTLLRAILGDHDPLEGELEVCTDLRDRGQIGYVPQHSAINPTLPTTVREFASLGFVGLGLPRAERRTILATALEQVGIADLQRQSLRALSGGQRQRALVARALVRRPTLLMVDEPTEGLDVAGADAFRRTVMELSRDTGFTLIFVTHNLHLASRMATHVALFSQGRIVTGPAPELLKHDVLERAFGISVDVNTGGPTR